MARAVYSPPSDGLNQGHLLRVEEAQREGVLLTKEQRREVREARRERLRQLPPSIPGVDVVQPVIQQAPVLAAQNEQIIEMGGVTCRNCGTAFIMNDPDDMKRVALQILARDPEFAAQVLEHLQNDAPPHAQVVQEAVSAVRAAAPPAEAPPEPTVDKAAPAKAKPKAKRKRPPVTWKKDFDESTVHQIVTEGEAKRTGGSPHDFPMHLEHYGINEEQYNEMREQVENGAEDI